MRAMKAAAHTQTSLAVGAILVIDDNIIIREALTEILVFLTGMPVYTAANGHEGVQIFQQQRQGISLVLLDMNMPVMNMPVMNGEQTCEKLQQIAPQVKVIVSSSLSQAEVRLRFGERELPTFLQKPYDINTLFNVVQTELTMV